MGHSIQQQDEQHLKLLAIFHYVLAGMVALFACFPIIHLIMGILFLVAPDEMFQSEEPEPPRLLFGLMFTIMPAMMILGGWLLAGLILHGGRCLTLRKRYTLCLVIAGLCCMFMPLGTVLGVFTIIVLIRPSVAALFEENRFEPAKP